jgi:hypothetical protein
MASQATLACRFVVDHPDATLAEIKKQLGLEVSLFTIDHWPKKLGLSLKKVPPCCFRIDRRRRRVESLAKWTAFLYSCSPGTISASTRYFCSFVGADF